MNRWNQEVRGSLPMIVLFTAMAIGCSPSGVLDGPVQTESSGETLSRTSSTADHLTPEMVVKAFLTAVREGNVEEAAKCIKPEDRDEFRQGFRQITSSGTLPFTIPDPDSIKLESVVKEEGGKKIAIVRILNVAEFSEPAPLEFSDGQWWLAVQRGEVRIDHERPTGSREEIDALVSRLSNGKIPERQEAAEKLLRLGSKAEKATCALVRAVKDEDDTVRYLAVKTLEKIKPDAEKLVPLLVNVLKQDKHAPVRAAAAEALGAYRFLQETADAKTAETVADMPEDADAVAPEDVRILDTPAENKEQPKNILEVQAVTALIEALGDSNRAVRMLAAEAIGRIGIPDERAVAPLLKLADDEDTWVAFHALNALFVHTGSQYVDDLDISETVDKGGRRVFIRRYRKKGGDRVIEHEFHIPRDEGDVGMEAVRVIQTEEEGKEEEEKEADEPDPDMTGRFSAMQPFLDNGKPFGSSRPPYPDGLCLSFKCDSS